MTTENLGIFQDRIVFYFYHLVKSISYIIKVLQVLTEGDFKMLLNQLKNVN